MSVLFLRLRLLIVSAVAFALLACSGSTPGTGEPAERVEELKAPLTYQE
ncbi:MAG TPA: hypothetical protein VNG33_14100 [Polyangiaceae bacterium]|nr:hypothetical protein [Polyangiaceae bacterium]